MRGHLTLTLFVTTWLLVLLCPTLRLMFLVQVRGSDLMRTDLAMVPLRSRAATFNLSALAVRHKDDVRVCCLAAKAADPRQTVRNYDQLLRRFPHEALVIANRLRYTCMWLEDHRVPYGAGKTEPLSSPFRDSEAVERAIAMARARRAAERQMQIIFARGEMAVAMGSVSAGPIGVSRR